MYPPLDVPEYEPEGLDFSMDLAIIIVSWNTSKLLLQCLNSIFASRPLCSFEIIVVDNGSVDDSLSMIESHFPSVILIKNDLNQGFARANNQGLSIARSKYFMLLNSDTIVLLGAIDRLVQTAEQNPEVGILGPKLLNMDGTVQKSWASFPSLLFELLGANFRVRHPIPYLSDTYDVDWIMGACMLVRSKAVEDAGKLDENYFFYSEEIDWCFRIKKKNWKVWYLASAEVHHLGGGSAYRGSLTQLVRLYRAKLLYFQKYHGSLITTLLRFGLALANTLGIIRRLVFFNWMNRKVAFQRISDQSKLVWCLLLNRYPNTG